MLLSAVPGEQLCGNILSEICCGCILELYFKNNSKDPLMSAVYAQNQRTGGETSWPDVYTNKMPDIESGKSVVIVPDIGTIMLMGFYKSNDNKGLFYISDEVMRVEMTMLMNKNLPSTIKESLNQRILHFRATRQLTRANQQQSYVIESSMWKPPGYEKGNDIVFLCVIWCGGICVSFFILLLEIFINRMSKRCLKDKM